jgi:replicative DNA helicase
MQPHDTDTENVVLATLMRYNGRFEENRDILKSDLFYYPREKAIYLCIDGLIRDGKITDINSLADYAQRNDVGYDLTKNDFLNKMYISLKECTESMYWIELLFRTDYLTKPQYDSILSDCRELHSLLSSITKTTRESIQ